MVKWNVIKLRNGRYNIQNFGNINYAHVGNRPRAGDAVEGRSASDQWIIKESSVNGQYTYVSSFCGKIETRRIMNNWI
jgi:hypothetical protein